MGPAPEEKHRLASVQAYSFTRNPASSNAWRTPAAGRLVGTAEAVEVDPSGEGAERSGLFLLYPAYKLSHIIPGGELELAGELAVDRVLHHHVQHSAAVVHHEIELSFQIGGGMAADQGAGKARILLGGDHIAPGVEAISAPPARRRAISPTII